MLTEKSLITKLKVRMKEHVRDKYPSNQQLMSIVPDGSTYLRMGACTAELRNLPEEACYIGNAFVDKGKNGAGILKPSTRRAYANWLVKESPYSKHLEHTTAKEVLEIGVVLSTQTPSNILYGTFIACRMLWEQPSIVQDWHWLVKGGVNKNAAWMLAHFFSHKGSLKSPNHVGFHEGGLSKEQLKNFMNNTPKILHEPLIEDRRIRDINLTWGINRNSLEFFRTILEDSFASGAEVVGQNPFTKKPVLKRKISRVKLINRLSKFYGLNIKETKKCAV
jgi:hypothetical protein